MRIRREMSRDRVIACKAMYPKKTIDLADRAVNSIRWDNARKFRIRNILWKGTGPISPSRLAGDGFFLGWPNGLETLLGAGRQGRLRPQAPCHAGSLTRGGEDRRPQSDVPRATEPPGWEAGRARLRVRGASDLGIPAARPT